MNREDIIRMAREANLSNEIGAFGYPYLPELERFAALVAKHTLANIDPSSFMTWQEGYEAGKQAEREACIKVCEEVTADLRNYASAFEGVTAEIKFVRNIGAVIGEPFIDAIKARGQE